MFKKTAIALTLLGVTSLAQADVLTSVKPLGFIANAITDGVTETKVLLPVTASPHDYSLKPSDIEQLKSAQLVVWVGEGLEIFLEKSITHLPKENVLTLDSIPAIQTIVKSSKKEQEEKDDHHDHHSHAHSHDHGDEHHHDQDWHIWFSSEASEVVAEQIADRLIEKMPQQADKIQQNLANFKADLAAKKASLEQQLSSVKTKGYYTFHDAYGYFERSYGLNSLGAFTINPSVAPGAKTLNAIKKNIQANKAQCLFAEPQFTPKVLESLSKGTQTKVAQLDPLGAKIKLSKTAYTQFLQAIADEFSQCLQ